MYSQKCLPAMEQALLTGKRRIISIFPQVRVHTFSSTHVATIDQDFSSFSNINTPSDYFDLAVLSNGEQRVAAYRAAIGATVVAPMATPKSRATQLRGDPSRPTAARRPRTARINAACAPT